MALRTVVVGKRRAALIALCGAGLAVGGCFAYRPVALSPAPGANVRVIFSGTAEVITVGQAPDTARRVQPGVLEASGTIQAAGADTIALRLGELRTSAGPVAGVSGRVALLPVAQVARIEERKFQPVTTILTAGGVAAVALSAFLVVVLAAMIRGF
jgi:hypothetical protein